MISRGQMSFQISTPPEGRNNGKEKEKARRLRKKGQRRDTRFGPAAYASGAVAKCRKVGAANWGNSTKKAATGGLMTAVDNPKRPARNRYRGGGIIASGCGCVRRTGGKVRGRTDGGKELFAKMVLPKQREGLG